MIKYKKYHLPAIYRGYQVFLMCCASSYKKAAEKFEMKEYYVRSYAGCVKADENDVYFDGVMGYIDSGYVIFEYGRTDLHNKKIPYDELKVILDKYRELKRIEHDAKSKSNPR